MSECFESCKDLDYVGRHAVFISLIRKKPNHKTETPYNPYILFYTQMFCFSNSCLYDI